MKTCCNHCPTILIACLAFFAFLSGCNLLDSNANDYQGLEIQTEKETYSITGNETISSIIRNRSEQSVYISLSDPVLLEKNIDGTWEHIGAWYGTIGIVLPLGEIAPGEDFSSFPVLESGDPFIPGPGLYRFSYGLFSENFDTSKGMGGSEYALPLYHRVSNPFHITE